jgi:hypothetical protein
LVDKDFLGGLSRLWKKSPFCLILAGFIGATIGKGRGRILTALVATMGFLLWLPVAFL